MPIKNGPVLEYLKSTSPGGIGMSQLPNIPGLGDSQYDKYINPSNIENIGNVRHYNQTAADVFGNGLVNMGGSFLASALELGAMAYGLGKAIVTMPQGPDYITSIANELGKGYKKDDNLPDGTIGNFVPNSIFQAVGNTLLNTTTETVADIVDNELTDNIINPIMEYASKNNPYYRNNLQEEALAQGKFFEGMTVGSFLYDAMGGAGFTLGAMATGAAFTKIPRLAKLYGFMDAAGVSKAPTILGKAALGITMGAAESGIQSKGDMDETERKLKLLQQTNKNITDEDIENAKNLTGVFSFGANLVVTSISDLMLFGQIKMPNIIGNVSKLAGKTQATVFNTGTKAGLGSSLSRGIKIAVGNPVSQNFFGEGIQEILQQNITDVTSQFFTNSFDHNNKTKNTIASVFADWGNSIASENSLYQGLIGGVTGSIFAGKQLFGKDGYINEIKKDKIKYDKAVNAIKNDKDLNATVEQKIASLNRTTSYMNAATENKDNGDNFNYFNNRRQGLTSWVYGHMESGSLDWIKQYVKSFKSMPNSEISKLFSDKIDQSILDTKDFSKSIDSLSQEINDIEEIITNSLQLINNTAPKNSSKHKKIQEIRAVIANNISLRTNQETRRKEIQQELAGLGLNFNTTVFNSLKENEIDNFLKVYEMQVQDTVNNPEFKAENKEDIIKKANDLVSLTKSITSINRELPYLVNQAPIDIEKAINDSKNNTPPPSTVDQILEEAKNKEQEAALNQKVEQSNKDFFKPEEEEEDNEGRPEGIAEDPASNTNDPNIPKSPDDYIDDFIENYGQEVFDKFLRQFKEGVQWYLDGKPVTFLFDKTREMFQAKMDGKIIDLPASDTLNSRISEIPSEAEFIASEIPGATIEGEGLLEQEPGNEQTNEEIRDLNGYKKLSIFTTTINYQNLKDYFTKEFKILQTNQLKYLRDKLNSGKKKINFQLKFITDIANSDEIPENFKEAEKKYGVKGDPSILYVVVDDKGETVMTDAFGKLPTKKQKEATDYKDKFNNPIVGSIHRQEHVDKIAEPYLIQKYLLDTFSVLHDIEKIKLIFGDVTLQIFGDTYPPYKAAALLTLAKEAERKKISDFRKKIVESKTPVLVNITKVSKGFPLNKPTTEINLLSSDVRVIDKITDITEIILVNTPGFEKMVSRNINGEEVFIKKGIPYIVSKNREVVEAYPRNLDEKQSNFIVQLLVETLINNKNTILYNGVERTILGKNENGNGLLYEIMQFGKAKSEYQAKFQVFRQGDRIFFGPSDSILIADLQNELGVDNIGKFKSFLLNNKRMSFNNNLLKTEGDYHEPVSLTISKAGISKVETVVHKPINDSSKEEPIFNGYAGFFLKGNLKAFETSYNDALNINRYISYNPNTGDNTEVKGTTTQSTNVNSPTITIIPGVTPITVSSSMPPLFNEDGTAAILPEETPQTGSVVGGENLALKDVESTAKALESDEVAFDKLFNRITNDNAVKLKKQNLSNEDDIKKTGEFNQLVKSPKRLAETYHKAKADGSNPELVKAVEQSLKETTKEGSVKPAVAPVSDIEILRQKLINSIEAVERPSTDGGFRPTVYYSELLKNNKFKGFFGPSKIDAIVDIKKGKYDADLLALETNIESNSNANEKHLDTVIEENTTEKDINNISKEEGISKDQVKGRIKEAVTKAIDNISYLATLGKSLKRVVKKILGAFVIFGVLFSNINAKSLATDYTPTVNKIEVTSQIKTDPSFKNLTPDGKSAYLSEIKNNLPFIIVDKPTATGYVYNSTGTLLKSFPVLLGSSIGDDINTAIPGDPAKKNTFTTAGKFTLSSNVGVDNSITYNNKILVLEASNSLAIHKIYPGDLKNRTIAINTPEISDNRMTWGCINISEENYDKFITPNIKGGNKIIITRDFQDNLSYDATQDIEKIREGIKDQPANNLVNPITNTNKSEIITTPAYDGDVKEYLVNDEILDFDSIFEQGKKNFINKGILSAKELEQQIETIKDTDLLGLEDKVEGIITIIKCAI